MGEHFPIILKTMPALPTKKLKKNKTGGKGGEGKTSATGRSERRKKKEEEEVAQENVRENKRVEKRRKELAEQVEAERLAAAEKDTDSSSGNTSTSSNSTVSKGRDKRTKRNEERKKEGKKRRKEHRGERTEVREETEDEQTVEKPSRLTLAIGTDPARNVIMIRDLVRRELFRAVKFVTKESQLAITAPAAAYVADELGTTVKDADFARLWAGQGRNIKKALDSKRSTTSMTIKAAILRKCAIVKRCVSGGTQTD